MTQQIMCDCRLRILKKSKTCFGRVRRFRKKMNASEQGATDAVQNARFGTPPSRRAFWKKAMGHWRLVFVKAPGRPCCREGLAPLDDGSHVNTIRRNAGGTTGGDRSYATRHCGQGSNPPARTARDRSAGAFQGSSCAGTDAKADQDQFHGPG